MVTLEISPRDRTADRRLPCAVVVADRRRRRRRLSGCAEHRARSGDGGDAGRAGGTGRPAATHCCRAAGYELMADIWPVPNDVAITPVEMAGRPAEWVAAPGAG